MVVFLFTTFGIRYIRSEMTEKGKRETNLKSRKKLLISDFLSHPETFIFSHAHSLKVPLFTERCPALVLSFFLEALLISSKSSV